MGRLAVARSALGAALTARLHGFKQRLGIAAGMLDAISPLATLDRGYAIVTDDNGHVVTTSTSLAPGQRIRARLAKGEIQARVESVTTGENKQLTLLDDGNDSNE